MHYIGYLDVHIRVNTAGGHSSIPPHHTSIGYLSLIIAELESHPRKAQLHRGHPVFKALVCEAVHAPKFPASLKRDVIRAAKGSDSALKRLEDVILDETPVSDPHLEAERREIRSILATTQAVDLISGMTSYPCVRHH